MNNRFTMKIYIKWSFLQIGLAVLVSLVLVFGVSAAQAALLLDGTEATVRLDGSDIGKPSFDMSGVKGYRPQTAGDFVNGGAEYLYYDLTTSPIRAEEGTITATLVRGNVTDHEMVFGFADANWKMFWGFQIRWDDLAFDRIEQEISLYQLRVKPVSRSDLPMPELIQSGAVFQIGFAWKKDKVTVTLDGRDLGAIAKNLPGFIDMLNSARYLLVGAETDPNIDPGGAYSTLGSRLLEFKVHDTFGAFWEQPVITSVTHDAFAVAGYSGKLVTGDTYKVTLKAEPGGTATFALGSIRGHSMTETSPGNYVGTHIIKYGEDAEKGELTGHFINASGVEAVPVSASRPVDIDTRVYMDVNASNDLIPADEDSKAGITIVAKDANGREVEDHQLKLTMSTTDEYTGLVGGGSFEDLVGGEIEVDWGGVTDSFGEVTAQYVSGFAAKTILVSAKDMVSGDVGIGFVRSFIEGEVEIVVTEPKVSALSVAGTMDVSLSREWLTADGKSRSRITAVVKDASGKALSGHSVRFTLLGNNGSIRMIQGKTDSKGRAMADYIAGIVMGQVQVEVRDLTSGIVVLVPIELRPDAPAEIVLVADYPEVITGGQNTLTATVTDANGNPNSSVDVLFDVASGGGFVSAPTVGTDEDGVAEVIYNAGTVPGIATVKGTVMSRAPTSEEVSAAEGAVFLFGLEEDPGRLNVVEWFVESGDEVIEGQDLVTLEDRRDNLYTVVAPRDGIVSTFVAEERDRVEYGDTLGYVIEVEE